MNNPNFSQRILAVAMGAAFLTMTGAAVAAPAGEPQARGGAKSADRDSSRSSRKSEAVAETYPEATRKNPTAKASQGMSRKMTEMGKLFDADKRDEARVIADEILADSKANSYEKAYAAQFAAQIAYEADDMPAAIGYFKQAIDADGLDNNAHYGLMINLAQLQQQEEQYVDSLATFDRFFAETRSTDPTLLMVKGQGLYLMQRYDDAAATIKQAIAASDAPKPEWLSMLMQVYLDADQIGEAVKTAEQIAAANPDDKRAQMNLASIYSQADMSDKALGILENLRSSGNLDSANEYKVLFTTYAGIDGREKDVIAVINDGLEKGVLQPEYNTYVALAQAYYFSDQPAQAITAYEKAAPMAKDGETYLNLARVLQQENRITEAKAAARQALAKGIKREKDANVIIALPGK
ncbi:MULTISPECIES: tetratricopeptide repeat protein [Lysobacteraceae]|uniref:Tetratricopeptide repeat protein n=1 Tax=Novilysobacter avium TaxID=2781023 RepID=A0A7S6ZUK5_9GAMM|nr:MULTISPECIES: tetratricopeptide repeat protein [Lysobacter]QOW22070.1 tetratricopeptide repeat protein [Lysobacter avium]QOW24544.1 tetratricopeptide repeat protein [Lysobacter sp. H23M47]